MVEISAVMAGAEVSRGEILDWEERRLPKAARRIGLATPAGDLPTRRLAFADDKLALGGNEVRRRLARPLKMSAVVSRTTSAVAHSKRVTSICDLHVTGGDAATFVEWFTDDGRPDYERSMVAANPDHFLIATAPDGRQEVIETTGGSPLPARFFVDYHDDASLCTGRDPGFPFHASGVAQTNDGAAIGGVRHQFRDERGGFHARLGVEFPSTVLPRMVSQHRWHLAAEFANWIEFAFNPDERSRP